MAIPPYEILTLAHALIERKLRTSIIHIHTGIAKHELRTMYRHRHGTSPSSGLMASTELMIATRKQQIYASVFASVYKKIGGDNIYKSIDIVSVMNAWDLYTSLVDDDKRKPATITDGWIIARDLRSGIAKLRYCSRCNISYLSVDESRLPPSCPICTYSNNKQRQTQRKKRSRNIANNVSHRRASL